MGAIMNHFMVNMTGQTYELHDDNQNNKVVGRLYPREAFVWRQVGSVRQQLMFLNSQGNLQEVWINENNYPLPNGLVDCCDYPYSEEWIDGHLYKIFKMRRTMKVYTAGAREWGTVAAGMFVATRDNSVGYEHPDWKLINYVKRTDGQWIKVTGDGYEHGFVDTGLSIASGYDSIPFYGSW